METPGIALVGAGRWGKNHYRVLRELGVLSAVCDANGASAAAFEGKVPDDLRLETELDAVLADPSIKGIVLATPAATHLPLARRALEAGKHVLCEKPLALQVTEGEALKSLAAQRQLTLMVGHVLAFHPVVEVLRRLVRGGELGRLRYLYSHRLNMGVIRSEENALWSFAPHDLALCLLLLGRMPERIACQGEAYLSRGVADVTLTSLDFGQGLRGHIFVSWLHPFKEQRFVLVGEKQMAVFDDREDWSRKLMLYAHEVSWVDGQMPEAKRAEGVPVPLQAREPLKAQAETFLRAITQGEHPRTDAAHGVEVLRMLEAAQRSLESDGATVLLERRAGQRVTRLGAGVFIHPSAVVDPGATLGAETKVWHFSHVMGSASLGERCVLGQGTFIGAHVRLGHGVRLQNHVSVFDGVELDDEVFCGPAVTFTNVRKPRAFRSVGGDYAKTHVGRGATLGANATIVCGVDIGPYAFVGAGSTVTRDVPAHALVLGSPAKQVAWVSETGERLVPDGSTWKCPESGKRYELPALPAH